MCCYDMVTWSRWASTQGSCSWWLLFFSSLELCKLKLMFSKIMLYAIEALNLRIGKEKVEF